MNMFQMMQNFAMDGGTFGGKGGAGMGGGKAGGNSGDGGRAMRAAQQDHMRSAKQQREAEYFWQQQRALGGAAEKKTELQWETEEHEIFSQHDGSVGIDFANYDAIPVEMSGAESENVQPIESFDQLAGQIPEFLTANIQRCNYTKPTPIQRFAIPAAMSGRDAMCCAQTGSGKTCAFLLPIFAFIDNQTATGVAGVEVGAAAKPKVVILAPTRELCSQIHLECRKLAYRSNIRASEVYGGVDAKPQLYELAKGSDVVTATPGRLTDFIGRGCVSMSGVGFLVLDEADRMLDMGFEPQIREIVQKGDMPSSTQGRMTLMFSATFPNPIQTLAAEFLNNYIWVGVGQVGGAVNTVEMSFHHVENNQKQEKLVEVLMMNPTDSTLIFVSMKRTAAALEQYLLQNSMSAASIHGDMEQPAREHALKQFREGQVSYLVATDVAGRGLDIPTVSHVINYDLPDQMESYVHRVGRTGRVGRHGRATSFYQTDGQWSNVKILGELIGMLEGIGQEVPAFMQLEASKNGIISCGPLGNSNFGGRDSRGGGGVKRKFNAGGGGGGDGGKKGGVCKNFQKGQCRWGAECYQSHGAPSPSPMGMSPMGMSPMMGMMGMSPMGMSPMGMAGGGGAAKKGKKTCAAFLKGQCKWGEECYSAHA